ncbi:dihydrofolate reductase [Dysgonomonas alginatilytica]|uniref:Dihydrofolate reductase n=1 Tax=Dysgonomonas alginatilytica TaxID=1605892 RepID=A0A2V3PMN0_9BACT|nr:dihydrofolate reductase family protein [Dysgonomonas alginatilytica]PXV61111.1 dihydrofolate reductase [Dysgonomonas alginatilytica]
MRKIKLYIASSIDGYIASLDGDLDWLTEFPNPQQLDYGYKDFFESIDTVIMGGKTYRDILAMDVVWPYKDKETYIVTRHAGSKTEPNIHFLNENIIETISELKSKQGKDIWLVGGGELVSMFLNSDIIDNMIITYIPIILGDGIPLFPKMKKESQWQLLNSQSYNNGVLCIDYQKIK